MVHESRGEQNRLKMLFLVFQLLLIAQMVTEGEGAYSKPYFSTLHEHYRKMRGGPTNKEPTNAKRVEELENKPSTLALIGLVDAINSKQSRKNPQINKVPRSSVLQKDFHVGKNLSIQGEKGDFDAIKNVFLPQLSEKTNSKQPVRQKAKKFWNHFMYKMNSDLQDMVLPIKTQELEKGSCRTVPFSQNIIHKGCKKMVLRNNLCFGKCTSLHLPGLDDQVFTCSRCMPSKFTTNRVQLNCTRPSNVVKVIMLVEECKCEVHYSSHHPTAHFIMDSSKHG
ncbi:cerberus [Bombina bombina]|uniref:cerberus n=1 Tax=Bombina bombina TaxID=8345 RepID=UPI00235B2CB6|nr:cerberus [Bombina bombina]